MWNQRLREVNALLKVTQLFVRHLGLGLEVGRRGPCKGVLDVEDGQQRVLGKSHQLQEHVLM
jgi:hypothetical protein